MAEATLEYAIPANVRVSELEASLCRSFPFVTASTRSCRRRFFDTFDWRLYARGTLLEERSDGAGTRLLWYSRRDSRPPRVLEGTPMPRFAKELPPGAFRDRLEHVTGVRALLPQATLQSRIRSSALQDTEGKTLLWLAVESDRLRDGEQGERRLGKRLRLEPLRGYEEVGARVASAVERRLGLHAADTDLLSAALAAQGRAPSGYSNKLRVALEPGMRTDEAARRLFRHLLQTMEANLRGVRANLDTEFLHDLRVAARRSRTLLAELNGVFPKRTQQRYIRELKWIGSITGALRDLDVYLLEFDAYKASLPPSLRDDLDPFRDFLQARHATEHKTLQRRLDSARWQRFVTSWSDYLSSPVPQRTSLADAPRPVEVVAAEHIWRAYKRVRRAGRKIEPETMADELHRLRIKAKRLRYLIEAFRSLYPRRDIAPLLRRLKTLQEYLGRHQDLMVHAGAVRDFGEHMHAEGRAGPATLAAMEQLAAAMVSEQGRTRAAFATQFRAFDTSGNREHCKRLVRPR